MMREYVTVCTTGILLHATKRVVFITFLTFPSNPSASRPNYFDNLFCQRSLVSFILIGLNICTVGFPLRLD